MTEIAQQDTLRNEHVNVMLAVQTATDLTRSSANAESTARPILLPTKSSCDFLLVIYTNLHPPCTVSKLWLVICQIFASDRGVPHFNGLASRDPLRISPQ